MGYTLHLYVHSGSLSACQVITQPNRYAPLMDDDVGDREDGSDEGNKSGDDRGSPVPQGSAVDQ